MPDEAALSDLAVALKTGTTTAREVAAQCLARIAGVDQNLRSVLLLNPEAMSCAEVSDTRRVGKAAGALEGLPILVKDNIDTAGLATTAGSLALAQNVPSRHAPLVQRLLDAGAVVLGKTNLSEWANIRSRWSTSGWSAVGGLTRNPYALNRSAGGSSSGSAVAVAAGLAPAAIGTETDGSITYPAALNGIVGLKPTVGLISRTGIIPISQTQDTPGPMTRTVRDAAQVLTVLAGSDPTDIATQDADAQTSNYAAQLDAGALKGTRLGVMRFLPNFKPQTLAAFEAALNVLRDCGATIVDLPEFDLEPIQRNRIPVLLTELKVGLAAYLTTAGDDVPVRTLRDIIAFNRREPRELQWFGQELFELAVTTAGLSDPAYLAARDTCRRAAGADGIDRLLGQHRLDALIAPTSDAAWIVDPMSGDHFNTWTSTLPASAGYPHLTVPMGFVQGLPLGLSFIGPAWSEARILALGYAFEQQACVRAAPTYQDAAPLL